MKIKVFIILALNFFLGLASEQYYLYKYFPKLEDSIPYVPLGDFPTPIGKCNNFSEFLGYKNIYIKRDDLAGKIQNNGIRLYSGNKLRKLQHLLAAAKKYNKSVITHGCAGSNHALCTAIYCKQLCLPCTLMLMPQPHSSVVCNNLLIDYLYDAQMKFFPTASSRASYTDECLKNGDYYFIPTGGSNSLGVVGFVNAAFELKEQIALGSMPKPDIIYMAIGTAGSTAGLLLGLQAAGLKIKVKAVGVEPENSPNEYLSKLKKLFKQTNEYLHSLDSSFKIFEFPENSIEVYTNHCGTEYGLLTPEAMQIIELFKEQTSIQLEGTYTVKPIFALIDDIKNKKLQNEVVLFWNTYCGQDSSYLTKGMDYKKLPNEFHEYFN